VLAIKNTPKSAICIVYNRCKCVNDAVAITTNTLSLVFDSIRGWWYYNHRQFWRNKHLHAEAFGFKAKQ